MRDVKTTRNNLTLSIAGLHSGRVNQSHPRRILEIHHNGETGRFGNVMFSYASIKGIAFSTNRTSTFTRKFASLHSTFSKIQMKIVDGNHRNYFKLRQNGSFSWEPNRLIADLPPQDVQICCWLQVWKYFSSIEENIRHEFTFKDTILKKTSKHFKTVTNEIKKTSNSSLENKITFVGVHIRGGDMRSSGALKLGFRFAPSYYINAAMDYYREKYSSPQFMVCTDDQKWVKKHIDINKNDIHLINTGSAESDMALLTQCNHSIMTVGTFGWWSSYLAGGEVVYYHPPSKPRTPFGFSYVRDNLYPGNWTCLTDDPFGEKLNHVRPCRPDEQIQ